MAVNRVNFGHSARYSREFVNAERANCRVGNRLAGDLPERVIHPLAQSKTGANNAHPSREFLMNAFDPDDADGVIESSTAAAPRPASAAGPHKRDLIAGLEKGL